MAEEVGEVRGAMEAGDKLTGVNGGGEGDFEMSWRSEEAVEQSGHGCVQEVL